ncbi:MAG: winged helix-turn-helix domain-containing protein [Phycisphaerae bacterium]|nr:winged helix-turn-helix domain-containing protein [Phycisphaerae bacterium]
MSKRSSTRTKKPSAPKSPRMSKNAARADGAAKTERLRKAAIAEIAERLADGKEDHEVPTAKEVANATHARTTETKPTAKAKAKRGNAEKAPKEKGAKATPTPEAKPKRASGLDLAAKVLASAKEPLNAKSIAERVLAAGWSTSGKTPHATLYAAMIREIAAKGKGARFRKTDRGLFTPSNGKGA